MTTTPKSIRTSRGPRLRAVSKTARAVDKTARAARAGRWTILRNGTRVRWSRIQTAQARIASGYYERDEVQDFVVDAILRELKRH